MAEKLDIKDANRHLKVTTVEALSSSNSNVISLLRSLDEMSASVPLASMSFDKTGSTYVYSVSSTDGRTWSQVVTPVSDGYNSTSSVTGSWSSQAAVAALRIIESLMQLASLHAVTKVTCTW